MAGFDTKPNFNSQKFEQCAGDIMNLSGCTQIFSALDMESGSTLSVCNGATFNLSTDAGIDKILRSNAAGDGTWIELPVKDAKNALTVTDGTVLLGGSLIQETDVDLNSNLFSITNMNPPFDIGSGFDSGGVAALTEDSNGKYVASGSFHNYSGVTAEGLARLNSDGSRDTSLEIGTGFWKTGGSTAVSTHTLQDDGKILVGGSFTQYSGASYSNLVRLHSDGRIDTSFTPPESSLAGVRVIYVKDDGKILVGGDFTKHLMQLNSDGTEDTDFVVGTGFLGGRTLPNQFPFVLGIAEQPNGQLIIAGDYTTYSGISAGHLIRLYPDGRYDPTFDTNPGFDHRVRRIALQSDGKIVVVGEFTGYTDSILHNSSGVARLNTDGTYDSTFDVGDGFTGNTGTETYHIGATQILKQVNNQFLLTGFFTWYNGTVANGVIRLNNDATIDSSFDSGTGFNTVPTDAIVTSDGKFLVGGAFTSYSGETWNRLIRLSYYGDIDNEALDSEVIFNGKVIEYGDNYELYYTNRSLVDKEYVDNLVATGTSNITGGANGLCTCGNNIVLGGDLTGNTIIDTCGNNFTISSLPASTGETNVIYLDANGKLACGPITAGCGDYSLTSPATCTVGGVSPGYVLTGKTLECIIRDAFAPYIEPTFSAFNVALDDEPFEVGCVLSGNKSFSWTTTTSTNVESGSVGIRKTAGSDAGALVGSGFDAGDSPQSLSICTITDSTPTTHTWQITGCSTQNDSFNRSNSECSIYPYFWGTVTCATRPDVTNDLVTGGTKVVATVGTNVGVTFNSSNQYTWFAQPTDYSSPRTKWFIAVGNCGFVDRGNPSDRYPDVCTLNITDANGCWSGVSYEVYMSDFSDTLSDTLYFRTY